ncbi:hypothetical protein JX265_012231 [Neoarthrinium moseri]|uniref:DUF8032 domain-containing protein n=1 Tax=Neoarthrinium moseri TaxID=1658444 RepID=A0A9P9WB07_9PEZI|nr:hypothetical protein JX266_010551 [Neoarthrinium moseri]KAI1855786.1 hypothetical protein JX265_012231 [Neoarthrinium moseri]
MLLSRRPWDQPFGGWGSRGHIQCRYDLPLRLFDSRKQNHDCIDNKKARARARQLHRNKTLSSHLNTGGNTSFAPPTQADSPDRVGIQRDTDNSIQWVTFKVSRTRPTKEYTIRCDLKSVDIKSLPESFKEDNTVYPLARGAKSGLYQDAVHHLALCNVVGWSLARLNPILEQSRELLYCAVEAWLADDPNKASTQFGYILPEHASPLSGSATKNFSSTHENNRTELDSGATLIRQDSSTSFRGLAGAPSPVVLAEDPKDRDRDAHENRQFKEVHESTFHNALLLQPQELGIDTSSDIGTGAIFGDFEADDGHTLHEFIDGHELSSSLETNLMQHSLMPTSTTSNFYDGVAFVDDPQSIVPATPVEFSPDDAHHLITIPPGTNVSHSVEQVMKIFTSWLEAKLICITSQTQETKISTGDAAASKPDQSSKNISGKASGRKSQFMAKRQLPSDDEDNGDDSNDDSGRKWKRSRSSVEDDNDNGDAVDEDTLAKLRSRKKGTEKTVQEKWNTMYQTIFPNDTAIPTCFDEVCRQLPAVLQALNQQLYDSFQMTNTPQMDEESSQTPESPIYTPELQHASNESVSQLQHNIRNPRPELGSTYATNCTVGNSMPPFSLEDFAMPAIGYGDNDWPMFDSTLLMGLGVDIGTQEKSSDSGYGSQV